MANSARHSDRRKHQSEQKAKEIKVHRNKQHSNLQKLDSRLRG